MGYYASRFYLSARLESGGRIEDDAVCYRAQDSMTFLHLMEKAWQRMMQQARGARIRKISVSVHNLVAASDLQPELFAELPEADLKKRLRAEKMSRALDKINHRFGRDSILVGMTPMQGRSFSGTKIAFTRIPDMEEFLE
jgi:DNA polymerase-4